jgi:hypothetical protein
MLKKFASFILVAALTCTLCGIPAFAQTPSQPEVKWNRVNDSTDSGSAGKKAAQPHAELKADIQKLVADARAGKGLSIADPQNLPRQSNSLSKGTKIAIVVGVAVVVVLIIVVVKAANDDSIGPISIR